MGKNLVIVESPAKAKTIEHFLGKDYKVLSSKGHIRDLRKKNFGIDLETFRPQYEIPDDKQATVKQLRTEAKKADCVWLASDEDREGEAISWHLAEVLGINPKEAQRIVFHEITKPAIEYAIAHPRHINQDLVDAQQARRVLDRLVGFKLSPVLWKKVKRGLSAGRVQSVAVRIIVEREREIQAFCPESFFRVTAVFQTEDGQEITASSNLKFKTEEEVSQFLEQCAGASFSIGDIQKKPLKRTPAPPFTTSTLQQEAARRLGFSVSLTMRVAQSLYEAGHITYMRTDSLNLSQLCIGSAGALIRETMGKEYHKARKFRTNAKGAQEAHEAIRPTYIDRETINGTQQEKRLYELIRKRTIASQMADAAVERTTVSIDAEGENGFKAEFQAAGEVVTFDGFLRIYNDTAEVPAAEDLQAAGRLPTSMRQGEELSRQKLTATQRFSQPPVRYNEATLVRKLEELGIGRPSTYAPTISTIQQREYVVRGEKESTKRSFKVITLKGHTLKQTAKSEAVGGDRGRLVPTDTGIVVTDFLMENFPEIMGYNFTADVEKQFDAVALGEEEWSDVIRAFYENFEPQVERVDEQKTDKRVGERVLGIDPKTGRSVSARIGRFGPLIQIGTADDEQKPLFASLKHGQSLQTITLEEALELFRLPRTLGEYEGEEVSVNEGRFGPYVKHAGLFASIPKGEDIMNIDLQRAIELIEERRKAEREKHIKTFEEEPELEILSGRWGPYICYKGHNYRIPKPKHATAAELSLEQCLDIVESESSKKQNGKGRRK